MQNMQRTRKVSGRLTRPKVRVKLTVERARAAQAEKKIHEEKKSAKYFDASWEAPGCDPSPFHPPALSETEHSSSRAA